MAKEPLSNQNRRASRLKLWELPQHFHCSVIGTCLTISELHKIARQSRLQIPIDIEDYHLHATMVNEAANKGTVARNLHKQLDRKYHRWLNLVSSYQPPQFAVLWNKTVEEGEIAGLFWALMTHPDTTAKLINRIQQQVHMLSHLQGHSHHAKMRQSSQLQQQVSELKQQLEIRQQEHQLSLQQRDQLYQAQQKALQALQAQIELPPPDISELNKQLQESEKRNRQLLKRLDWAEEQLSHREIRLTEMVQGLEGLKEQLHEVIHEKENLESCLNRLLTKDKQDNEDSDSADLGGRHLIYVGGRRSTLPHIRTLTDSYNGTLIYHDGGLENNSAELQSQLSRADLVFCAIDCVSHNACLEVKRHCKKLEKPFVPLRNSSLSSFTSGLRHVIQALTNNDQLETLPSLMSQ